MKTFITLQGYRKASNFAPVRANGRQWPCVWKDAAPNTRGNEVLDGVGAYCVQVENDAQGSLCMSDLARFGITPGLYREVEEADAPILESIRKEREAKEKAEAEARAVREEKSRAERLSAIAAAEREMKESEARKKRESSPEYIRAKQDEADAIKRAKDREIRNAYRKSRGLPLETDADDEAREAANAKIAEEARRKSEAAQAAAEAAAKAKAEVQEKAQKAAADKYAKQQASLAKAREAKASKSFKG